MPGMGIAIVLLIGYVVTVAKHGATDVTAYKKGKEAPSIEKFRTRHREKAEGKLKAPKKSGGKEPGPVGKWARAVADNAAAELADKHRVKSEARRKWYQQTAPQREQQWRQKWQDKLDRRDAALEKWKRKRGLSTDADPAAEQEQRTTDESATDTTSATSPEAGNPPEQPPAQSDTPPADSAPEPEKASEPAPEKGADQPDTSSEPDQPQPTADTEPAHPDQAELSPGQSNTSFFASSTSTSGGNMYQQGAVSLTESAEEIANFCADLKSFADGLAARQFGPGITGQAADLATKLQPAGDSYSDLADDVRNQGDNVRDAYDQAPDIPKEAAMA